jgi:hypothetical protein
MRKVAPLAEAETASSAAMSTMGVWLDRFDYGIGCGELFESRISIAT